MTIAFIHSGKAFLPDLEAYCHFFESRGALCKVIRPGMRPNTKRDIDWLFMGMDLHRDRKIITIHEYCSCSVPPLRRLKDRLKSVVNERPDLRLFLNEAVRNCFAFTDGVPYGYRDIGIDASPESLALPAEKSTDLIYVGAVHNPVHFERLLQHVTKHLPERSLLIIGNIPQALQLKYAKNSLIRFEGPYSHEKVLSCIRGARYALNWMPDTPPFHFQSSLKFLEYAACRIPVITTDYHWIRDFEKKYGGRYYYVTENMDNLQWDKITDFPFSFPDLKDWQFEHQVARSGVLEFLQDKFPEWEGIRRPVLKQ